MGMFPTPSETVSAGVFLGDTDDGLLEVKVDVGDREN